MLGEVKSGYIKLRHVMKDYVRIGHEIIGKFRLGPFMTGYSSIIVVRPGKTRLSHVISGHVWLVFVISC